MHGGLGDPYMFTSCGSWSPKRANHGRRLSSSSASPPKITVRSRRRLATSSAASAWMKLRKADGVWLRTVTPSSAQRRT
ncbi:MAG: hypothetical protein WKG00_31960 [Polyangiaceae bacterium]